MRLTTILSLAMCAGLYGCYATSGEVYTSGGGGYYSAAAMSTRRARIS